MGLISFMSFHSVALRLRIDLGRPSLAIERFSIMGKNEYARVNQHRASFSYRYSFQYSACRHYGCISRLSFRFTLFFSAYIGKLPCSRDTYYFGELVCSSACVGGTRIRFGQKTVFNPFSSVCILTRTHPPQHKPLRSRTDPFLCFNASNWTRTRCPTRVCHFG